MFRNTSGKPLNLPGNVLIMVTEIQKEFLIQNLKMIVNKS